MSKIASLNNLLSINT